MGQSPCGIGPNGVAYSCPYLFTPGGGVTPQTGTRIGLGANGNFDGGNGSNNREYKLLGVYPTLDRYSVNVVGHLEVSEAFTPFIEAKYTRTDSMRWGNPAFFQGGTTGDPRERPRFDNPFLTDANRAEINAARAATGLTALGGTTQFTMLKNLADLGGRQEDATRETTRIVLGVGGQVSENWSYEVAANYGQFREDTVVLGNLNIQRFGLAMDAARNASGAIVCRSEFDPAAAFGYGDVLDNPDTPEREAGAVFADSTLAADIAQCHPLNPFGEGNISEQARRYVLQDTTSVGKIDQVAFSASLTGDSSAWFSLPAGAIGVAIGFEHREDDVFFEAEELVSSGITFYNALPLLDPPKQKVDEVFAEFRIPLLKEMTFAEELTLNLAGRYSEYNGDVGGVLAYNGSLEYMPIDGLRFRAGLARAVRAPSLSDLFSEQSQNFAQINDPCSFRNIAAGSTTRASNCAAAGIPGGPPPSQGGTGYDMQYTATPEILSGGNPELTEETSDSLTVGVVFQPSFLKGLTFSVDYFDIDIDEVITAPTAQQIMDACYDAPDLNNPFCGLFQRWGAAGGPDYDGSLNHPETPYALINGTLQQTLLNYASSTARGFDVSVGYSGDIGTLGRVESSLIYTKMLQIDDYLDPANPTRPDQVLLELGDPENAFNWSTNFITGKVKLGYQMRYIGRQTINLAEDIFEVGGRPPQNADYATKLYYHGLFYHDVRAAMDVTDSVNAYVGVDNLANRVPPLGATGTGAGSGIYDTRGRFFYAGVKLAF
jgi:outer membrane receptor protein involved in Fe transport